MPTKRIYEVELFAADIIRIMTALKAQARSFNQLAEASTTEDERAAHLLSAAQSERICTALSQAFPSREVSQHGTVGNDGRATGPRTL